MRTWMRERGMVDLKGTLSWSRDKLLRRTSHHASKAGSDVASKPQAAAPRDATTPVTLAQPRRSTTLTNRPNTSSVTPKDADVVGAGEDHVSVDKGHQESPPSDSEHHSESNDPHPDDEESSKRQPSTTAASQSPPALTVEEPTPDQDPPLLSTAKQLDNLEVFAVTNVDPQSLNDAKSSPTLPSSAELIRRQSLVDRSNIGAIKALLGTDKLPPIPGEPLDFFRRDTGQTLTPTMLHRKIWVRRPGASATLVQIREDDLVDDVRDMILRKYANSLGRSFDAPDVTLRIIPRPDEKRHQDRFLGPDEVMCPTLDTYYPDGQTVDDALIIEVPQRRTPKPSPRHMPHGMPYFYDDSQPTENGAGYFPPMPIVPSPAALTTASHDSRQSHAAHERAMSVITTGQVPQLPSPGGVRRNHGARPKYPRQHTSSPTAVTNTAISLSSSRITNRARRDSSNSDSKRAPIPPPLKTPPAAEPAPTTSQQPSSATLTSPRPDNGHNRRNQPPEASPLRNSLLEGSVPPINVLIVEDNMINLRVLGAFMQRLNVRWKSAVNGREAVTRWRDGGYHLVLMDIQLPIMNGLEATKEIRRLERINGIGVFNTSSASNEPFDLAIKEKREEIVPEDKLSESFLFKSPVIIVALTASSLQSDRHEALAAGCNDFLTKPVNFVWLERKVKEWGCMQALIDFDSWRKWKDYFEQNESKTDLSASGGDFQKPSLIGAKKSVKKSKKASSHASPRTNSASSPRISSSTPASKRAPRESSSSSTPIAEAENEGGTAHQTSHSNETSSDSAVS